MFWKILHLFRLRHSSEPPQLALQSPLRLYFHKHGELVARHPLRTILGSLLAVILACYPLPYLYGQQSLVSASGAIGAPGHSWMTSRQFSSYSHEPDIEIRQAWVQASRYKALDKALLEEALRIQETLLGEHASCSMRLTPDHGGVDASTVGPTEISNDVFFHSPLMYWNCSLELIQSIQNDKELLETVNLGLARQTNANITLRWGSVLAGKKFSQNRLIEADALVISLFYKPGNPAGDLWDQQAIALSKTVKDRKLEMYPRSGKIENYSQYEFVFQPLNKLDIFVITASYGLVLIYLGAYMRRMSAVRSRLGLFLTFLLEVTASVFSSFTVLAVLKIPVSHIPREFYPFVVLVVGLENMSRLLNAVFETAPEMPVQARIATAVGKVGFLSTVAVSTDLMFLLVVARISLPAVKEICVFLGLAIFLDFLLHLTFFVAVLRVEISRLELKDSLEKFEAKGHAKAERRTSISQDPVVGITDMILDMGNAPVSSRVAGTIIMICFVVAMNYHFVESDTFLDRISSIFQDIQSVPTDTGASPPSNQARTPTAWLRRQDQLMGKELIYAVKPGASRIVAKVFEPLFFMVEGSDRDTARSSTPTTNGFFDIDFSAVKGHIKTLLFTAALVLAIVTLFLNYILGFNSPDDEDSESEDAMAPVSCKSLESGHTLDVVLVVASKRGLLVSVGLDRKIVVWKLRATNLRYSKEEIRPTCAEHTLWPVLSIAVEDEGDWVAIAPKVAPTKPIKKSRLLETGISLWNVKESRFEPSLPIELHGRRPPGFFFAPRSESLDGPRLLIIKDDGLLLDIGFTRSAGGMSAPQILRISSAKEHMISTEEFIISAQPVQTPRLPFRIVSTTISGKVFVSTFGDAGWTTELIWAPSTPMEGPTERTITVTLPNIGLLLYSNFGLLNIIELSTGHTFKSVQTGQIRHNTLRAFNGKRQQCLSCGGTSVSSLSVAYTLAEGGTFVMNTYSPPTKSKYRRVCLRPKSTLENDPCLILEEVSETTHQFPRAGGWEATALNSVIGLHRRKSETKTPSSSPREYNLRRRRVLPTAEKEKDDDNNNWEIWTMEFDGKVALYSLDEWSESKSPWDPHHARRELLVSRTGPVAKIGPRTIGVAFGNNIKILSLGFERFHEEDAQDDISYGSTYPRKRGPNRTVMFAQS